MPNKKINHKCPLCRSSLTKAKFDKVTGIWQEKNIEMKKMKKAIAIERKKIINEKKKNQENLKKQKKKFQENKDKIIKTANKKTQTALNKKSNQLKKAIDSNKKLKRQLELAKTGRNEADQGRDLEKLICEDLKKFFKNDIITNPGKKGDILHTIKEKNKDIGTIIYECKKVPRHTSSHITQTQKAKSQRNADFGVLVTTAKITKKFKGYSVERGIIVISPEAVIVIAKVLRKQIVEINTLKMDKNKKHQAANNALNFLKSKYFKQPLETALQKNKDNVTELKKEMLDHFRYWNRRLESYQSIAGHIELVKESSAKSIQEGIDSLNNISFSNNKNIIPKIEFQVLVNKIKLTEGKNIVLISKRKKAI